MHVTSNSFRVMSTCFGPWTRRHCRLRTDAPEDVMCDVTVVLQWCNICAPGDVRSCGVIVVIQVLLQMCA
jgi:hypothetical protein